ncbi:Acetyltransferase (GNAT) family protein [Loktanella fryxellensis]|uniref:Acetyltransferase (GNAT) family protein n=1 Tax=Loktanella fryxellensis TaxID=245187 RepID=A0A1H7YX95_9RHOB|nr:GNAT family N-acetyltransferase [Loktanella fryxellensis]SEM49769.1 Acetyltransferase (GNAT) family protein [Loktanella fryxellensis]
MSDFDIRVVTPADIPDLVTMSGALGAFHGEDTRADAAALTRDLFATPPWRHGLIARHGLAPIRYARNLGTPQVQHARRGLDLHHTFVAADWRGRGVGRALLSAVEATARRLSCQYVSIGTDPDNTGARSASEAMGYIRRAPGPRFTKRLD